MQDHAQLRFDRGRALIFADRSGLGGLIEQLQRQEGRMTPRMPANRFMAISLNACLVMWVKPVRQSGTPGLREFIKNIYLVLNGVLIYTDLR